MEERREERLLRRRRRSRFEASRLKRRGAAVASVSLNSVKFGKGEVGDVDDVRLQSLGPLLQDLLLSSFSQQPAAAFTGEAAAEAAEATATAAASLHIIHPRASRRRSKEGKKT